MWFYCIVCQSLSLPRPRPRPRPCPHPRPRLPLIDWQHLVLKNSVTPHIQQKTDPRTESKMKYELLENILSNQNNRHLFIVGLEKNTVAFFAWLFFFHHY